MHYYKGKFFHLFVIALVLTIFTCVGSFIGYLLDAENVYEWLLYSCIAGGVGGLIAIFALDHWMKARWHEQQINRFLNLFDWIGALLLLLLCLATAGFFIFHYL